MTTDTPSSNLVSMPSPVGLLLAETSNSSSLFTVNTILVVGHEKLNVEMQRTYGNRLSVSRSPNQEVYVHLLDELYWLAHLLCQVVELDHSYRERVHNYQLHTYMYGQIIEAPPGISSATLGGETMTDLVLSPSSVVVGFDDFTIYRIGEG
jgi:polyribonucleotide 5'-hydroxyl-kinase